MVGKGLMYLLRSNILLKIVNGVRRWKNVRLYGIMNTETAGNPDFSGLPAFFVTNLLLVQCSI